MGVVGRWDWEWCGDDSCKKVRPITFQRAMTKKVVSFFQEKIG